MNIWVILIIGGVSALFAWQRSGALQLLSSHPRKNDTASNKKELAQSLDNLIHFLFCQNKRWWVEVLSDIRSKLGQHTTEAEALSRLSELFGGMGSLNDLVFSNAAVNQEASRLLDTVFRDMKLYHGTFEDRAHWEKLAIQHEGELAPRIRHAFRRE